MARASASSVCWLMRDLRKQGGYSCTVGVANGETLFYVACTRDSLNRELKGPAAQAVVNISLAKRRSIHTASPASEVERLIPATIFRFGASPTGASLACGRVRPNAVRVRAN